MENGESFTISWICRNLKMKISNKNSTYHLLKKSKFAVGQTVGQSLIS